jgi:DNA-binding MarR family transcriptional regulator
MSRARTSVGGTASGASIEVADRLHSVAIHILRRLRREDDRSGLRAPELSALSVIVFAGPLTLGALAEAEQVRPPTVSRAVAELEARGLVIRERDAGDGRVTNVRATPVGTRFLQQARERRVAALARSLQALAGADRALVLRALPVLEALARRE